MKRAVIAGVLLIGAVATAQANHLDIKWHDTIRPGGHMRSNAIGQANVNYCNRTVGIQYTRVSAAYKACMQRLGYRFVSAKWVRDGSGRGDGSVTYNQDSNDPRVGWHTEGGFRVCRQDCENPEIPGSGYTCRTVRFFGMNARECDSH
jgi:hypothetical protein